MSTRVQFDHFSEAHGPLSAPAMRVRLDFLTDDEDLYSRMVVAISGALGYPEQVEEKRPALGFHVDAETTEED